MEDHTSRVRDQANFRVPGNGTSATSTHTDTPATCPRLGPPWAQAHGTGCACVQQHQESKAKHSRGSAGTQVRK